MPDRDLASLNLNQLVALDALLRERNVGRAASRMGVTQSAMSHTLRALRELLGDPLLVRVGNAMLPTEHAESITGSLRRGLTELRSVVSGRAVFSPESIRDELTLAIDASTATVFVPALYDALRAHAPHASLRVATLDPARVRNQLIHGEVDAALLPPLIDLTGLRTEPTLESDASVLVRPGHPRIRKRLTMTAYCEVPHAVISLSGEGPGYVDELLAQLGKRREVRVHVPHLMALPELLVDSDLVSTVPTPAARFVCERWPLRFLPPPFRFPRMPMFLCWHERFDAHPTARFFRERVREAARRMQARHAH